MFVFLWFLSPVLYSFPSTGLFISSDNFISGYFILFDMIINSIVFLIFLADSVLVCRYATDFCILILYPGTLQNSLISTFLEMSEGFSMHSIKTSANITSFTSSFLIWIPFISFSCLIAVVRTSNIVLNKSGQNGYSCLVPDSEEVLHLFTLECEYDVSYGPMVFVMLKHFPIYPFCGEFLSWMNFEFCTKIFPASIEMIIWLLFFNFKSITDWLMVQSSWHPWNKSCWSPYKCIFITK